MHRDCPPKPSERSRHTCCTTSEHLLIFARAHANATHKLPATQQLRVSIPSSGWFYKQVSILRSIRGVCEVVMDPVLKPPITKFAGKFAFKQQQQRGLLLKSIVRLRRLFVGDRDDSTDVIEVASQMRTCRTALSIYQPGGHGDPTTQTNASLDIRWAEWALKTARYWQLRAGLRDDNQTTDDATS